MGILFNINKPRGYRHIPIYFDPEKEEREERLKNKTPEQQPKDGEYHIRLQRGDFRKADERSDIDQRMRQQRSEILKLLFLLSILIAIGVFLYMNGSQILSLYLD